MTHKEEPYIQEAWKSLHRTMVSLQNRSKLYTDGVLIVAMTRILRDLAAQYDKETFDHVRKGVADIFGIYCPDTKTIGEDENGNDILGEDQ